MLGSLGLRVLSASGDQSAGAGTCDCRKLPKSPDIHIMHTGGK